MPENGQVSTAVTPANAAPTADNLQDAMWRLDIKDNNQVIDQAPGAAGPGVGGGTAPADDHSNPYPDRPGEPDCIYYLKTGVCGYGTNCRYNHPNLIRQQQQQQQQQQHQHQQQQQQHNNNHQQGSPYRNRHPERTDQPDCLYFLKTGTCKYGSSCKYHHPQDKLDTPQVQLNIFGLPLRQEEKSCQYYMKTGACKFGIACKFNHPQPVGTVLPVPGSSPYTTMASSIASPSPIPLIGGFPSWSSQRLAYSPGPRMQAPTTYMPIVLPTSPGVMPGQHGWATYMSTLGPMPSSDALGSGQISYSKSQPLLPERPDQPECQYFMKTGNCKYGSSCKYHHPKEKQAPAYSIGPLGLPVRPGEPVCTFYSTYGTCKYGVACRYDHPLTGYYNYNVPAFSMADLSAFSPYSRNSPTTWTASNSDTAALKDFKRPDGFARFQMDNRNIESKVNALEDPTSQNTLSQPAPASEPSHKRSD